MGVVHNPLPKSSKSKFARLFDFVGTLDYTPYLCVPEAIAFRRDFCGGEQNLMRYITQLAREGGDRVAKILGTEVLGDENQRNSPMVMVRLPLDLTTDEIQHGGAGRLQEEMERVMSEKYATFLPLIFHGGHMYVRLSAQVYLTVDDFEKAAQILSEVCKSFNHKAKL